LISRWIRQNVSNAVIVGPDSESAQWVSAVASEASAPFTVLDKTRRGDRNVSISVKDWDILKGRTPVLVDDIISSGRTMLEAVRLLTERQLPAPVCIAVHGLFADNSDSLLAEAGARVVTSNSIAHPSNAMDVIESLAGSIREVAADLI
jgi:ribose-phosphate pyrophosphokinase